MENIEIKDEVEISEKRFYLPVEIKRGCPDCRSKCITDLSMHYLNYPTLNKKEKIYFYCIDCETEFECDIILKLSIEAETKVRKL